MMSIRTAACGTLAALGLAAAPAWAGNNWSIGVRVGVPVCGPPCYRPWCGWGFGVRYYAPAYPVYVAPAPVVVQPAPVIVQPPPVVQPTPGIPQPSPALQPAPLTPTAAPPLAQSTAAQLNSG